MKVMRKLLLVVLFTVLLTGCGVCSSEGAHFNSAIKEPINLNVLQADLIASITDNEKYLNKDLLHSVEGLADDDKINVIVTIDEQSIVGNYNNNNRGYSTLSEYAGSRYVSSTVNDMNSKQQKFSNEFLNKNYIEEVNHSYTTIINGFSAKTTYGQFKKLVKAEEEFSNEWFEGHLQSLIDWAQHAIELNKEDRISLENKEKIQSLVIDFLNKIHNKGN